MTTPKFKNIAPNECYAQGWIMHNGHPIHIALKDDGIHIDGKRNAMFLRYICEKFILENISPSSL